MLLKGRALPVSGKRGHSDAKSFGQQCVAAPESKSIQGSVSSKVDATKCSSKATSLKVVFRFLRPRSPTLKRRWFSSVRPFKEKVSSGATRASGLKLLHSPKPPKLKSTTPFVIPSKLKVFPKPKLPRTTADVSKVLGLKLALAFGLAVGLKVLVVLEQSQPTRAKLPRRLTKKPRP